MTIPGRDLSNTGSNEERPDRVVVYIDGFNFYHGMMAKGWGRYRWLDWVALFQRRIRSDQELVTIKYFTSMVRHEPEKLPRQEKFLRALEVRGGIEVIRGNFENRRVRCRLCDGWYSRPQERQTDVNLATHLVADAYEDLYDSAYLVSGDSDLAPAVELVKRRCHRRIVLIDPPRRHSDELADLADCHWHFSETHMRQCQLPNPVEYRTRRNKVRRFYRPESWE